MELLWPFLLIILGGLILVLIIQLVLSWFDQRAEELRTQIYFYQDEGSAQIMPWGETDWTKAHNGQLVLEGDRIDVAAGSRGVLSFYDGTWVRLDSNTELELEAVAYEDGEGEVTLDLLNGRIWVNVGEGSEVPIRLLVHTQNLRTISYGTIFEVGLTHRESVRVVEGEVLVEIFELEEDREVVLEQIRVGVGQQVEVTRSDLEAIIARQPVSLLEALDDDWKATDWYGWNRLEDANPTDFTLLEGEVAGDVEATEEVTEEIIEVIPEEEIEEPEDDDDTTAPILTVTVPSTSLYTLSESELSLSLSGTTGSNTEKVIVTSYDASGNALAYTLQQYVPGSTEWRYGIAEEYGNLREGRNLYSIVAVSDSGIESTAVEVIVEVPEGHFGEEADPSTEEDTATDEALTTPQVVSLNGDVMPVGNGPYTTDADVVTIIGSVSSGTAKVYVNGFQLSKYTAGSTTWTYYAREDLGNYEIGSNMFSVIAEDTNGNQSAALTFEIYREAP